MVKKAALGYFPHGHCGAGAVRTLSIEENEILYLSAVAHYVCSQCIYGKITCNPFSAHSETAHAQ